MKSRNLITLIVTSFIVVVIGFFMFKSTITEPFIDTRYRYLKCRQKGYTKTFCLQAPYARYPMFQCTCRNGLLGQRLPGIRRRCSCDYLDPSQNYLKDIYV